MLNKIDLYNLCIIILIKKKIFIIILKCYIKNFINCFKDGI
jgi:hypothetical protein